MGKKEEEEAKRLEAEKLEQFREQREKNFKRLQDEAKEYGLRKAILEDSTKYFENLLQKVREYKIPLRNEDEWVKFLKCVPIPNTQIPSDVRAFLYKFKLDFEEYFDKKVNWWLQCDERSDMNQDETRNPDRRRKIVNQIRRPIGSFYDKQFRLLMKAYESLDDSIRRAKVLPSRLKDLITIRESFRQTALNFLDVMTLEIITHIDREMESMTPLIAHYSYSSADFNKFIWSFKDVTLPPNREKLRNIKMEPLNMSLTMSSSLDLELSAVRGLWLKRDFFSDHCPSFKPIREMKFDNLATVVEIEMNVRREMTEKHLKAMRKARSEYEKRMEELALEEEAKKKSPGEASTPERGATKRREIEPPIVDECTYVDVEMEYVSYEYAKFLEEMDKMSPESLGLSENDVNMREYQILGGIFKLECLLKPSQTKEINFQLFIQLNELPNELKYEKLHETYTPPRMRQGKDERKSQFGRKFMEAKEEALSSLIKVELKLSNKIIWWESPVPCRFELWEESEEFNKLDPKMQDFNLNYEDHVKREQEKLFLVASPEKSHKKAKIEDFQLTNFPEKIKLSSLVEKYLASLIPADYPTHDEAEVLYEGKQAAWRKYVNQIRAKKFRGENIEKILKIAEVLKLYEIQYASPQNLFPTGICNRLKVIENEELKEEIKMKREKLLREIKRDGLNLNIGEDFPLKNEPLMLSELIKRFEQFYQKQIPNFNNVKVKFRDEMKSKKLKKDNRKSRHSSVMPHRKSSIGHKKLLKIPQMPTNQSIEDSTVKSSNANLVLIPHHKGKWSTKDIHEVSFDNENKTLTFYAGRLGNFGLAVKKFSNLPLKKWEIFPVIQKKMDPFVIMNIEAQKLTMEVKITAEGYTFKIIKPLKAPIAEIFKPVRIFELKKILTSINVNLFPEIDSSFYISNATEKHQPMEFHTYKSMATYCLTHHFTNDSINRCVDYRSAVFKSRQIDKQIFRNILVTPLNVRSINVLRPECTEDDIKLNSIFEISPAEQEFCPDLLNFLKTEVDKSEHRANQQNFMVIWFVQALLMNIRPLSFSE